MIKHLFKSAWRSVLKRKGFTLINIVGLATGLMCCLMIGLYVQDELSYDQYHTKKDRIFRVLHGDKITSRFNVWGNAPVGRALKADYPAVEAVTQFSGRASIQLRNGERIFQEDDVFFADSNVLEVFSWPLLNGDIRRALIAPNSIVLTESTAKKYFGKDSPVGKTLEGGKVAGRAGQNTYMVTGVLKDIPENSHFTFNALISMSSFRAHWPEVFDWWGYVDFYTYFLLRKPEDIGSLRAGIPDFLSRHLGNEAENSLLAYEPLLDAYLHSDAERQPGITGSLSKLYIFSVIGAFILFIACINFINLATARSMERAKEVGVRKVIGADRQTLALQFLSESILMILVSGLLAIAAFCALLPAANRFVEKHFAYSDLFSWESMGLFALIVAATALLAGVYPAFILSAFKPISTLKGSFKSSARGITLRKGLVTFQFCLSIALIAGTFVVVSQLNYLRQKDLGFRQDQMLVVDFNYDEDTQNNLSSLKDRMLAQEGVSSVSASRSVPGSFFPKAGTELEAADGGMKMEDISLFEVDIDFIPHFGIEMAAGRSYSRDFPSDTSAALVVNEAAARLYGYSDPKDIIGKSFSQWDMNGQVIGVTKDFNFQSLHSVVGPLALRLAPLSSRYLTLKIKAENLQATLEKVRQVWNDFSGNRPFLYSFLDESFNQQYQADQQFEKVFSSFSALAILIACLGLLGLATYSAEQRTKEIGVRKVLGASVSHIVALLSKDFVKLVLLAAVIASPLAWWLMNKWLEGFAYRMQIHWGIFVFASLLCVIIALGTISFQAIRAALTKPIDSLRDE